MLAVTSAVNHEIELDVVAACAQAEAAHGEIGTAKNGFLNARVGDVIHLAVKKLRVADGFDVHLLAHPFGAFTGNTFLFQPVGELKPVAVEDERLLFGLVGVKRGNETRLAKQEIQMLNSVQVFTERVVGVNREVGGYHRKP